MKQEFDPAPGVDIDNSLRYIEAVERAVRRDILKVDRSERSMTVGIIAGSLRRAADALGKFRADLEESGQADPPTEEQRFRLLMYFRRALEKDIHGN